MTINEALLRLHICFFPTVTRFSVLSIHECSESCCLIDNMEPLHVNLCDNCKELVFKATASTTLQRQTSPKELLNSSRSCHCCSTLSGIMARRFSEVRARFNISDKEIDHFPLTISHTAAQNSAGVISSKVVTATLELPNGFTYPSEMTIAWCLSDCKAMIPPRS